MNARGLMERVIMKVGIDAGVIGPAMFAMLLIRVPVTAAMTGPMLHRVQPTSLALPRDDATRSEAGLVRAASAFQVTLEEAHDDLEGGL